jgi:putative restriction endonuclease
VDAVERDRLIRLAAFSYLRRLGELHGEVLPIAPLRQGFEFEGQRVPLLGPQGIFKPAALPEMPISITTTPTVTGRPRPYEDEIGADGNLRYRYRGRDPHHGDNVGLRKALHRQVPLIYFHGIVPGQYMAQWPVYVMGDVPASLTFTVAMDDPQLIRPDLNIEVVDEVRRAYVTRLIQHRLHQLMFRQQVLRAYRESCSVCRLRHVELLDAAHILPDTDPRGDPIVPNGLALCKLHHAAFDRHIIGVRPDLVVDVRHDILEEVDGPMLRHGPQELQGNRLLVIPGRREERPNPEFLAERYERFRLAG